MLHTYSEKIFHNLQKKVLIKDFDKIVVAVSAGPDSMCLLHYLLELKQKSDFLNLKLFVAHINHNTRSIENDQEEQLIRDFCLNHNIPFFRTDYHYSGQHNFHDEARKFRYAFFRSVSRQIGATKIALAHHQDDQVETILFKLVRGTNILGYGGIKEIDELEDDTWIIRPFLTVYKNDLIDYCTKFNIPYLNDSSNKSNNYTRNKIRNKIIPLLTDIQSDAKEKLMQFKIQMDEVGSLIEGIAKDTFNRLHTVSNEGNIIIEIDKLLSTHQSIMRLVITYAINSVSNDNLEISFSNINTLIDIMQNDKPNITYSLGRGFYCIKQYNQLIFKNGLDHDIPFEIEIDKFREYMLPNLVKLNVKKVQEKAKTNNKCLFLCYNTSMWPLFVRSHKKDDIIETKIGHKKINRIFINNKIPKREREQWPIITDKDNNILWVVGLEKSSRCEKCSDSNYIMIEIK